MTSINKRNRPPFRADHVGSLLRPPALKRAREQRQAGAITAAALKAAEDREIERIIRKQEDLGLADATDGELRRAMWHYDFLEHLDGVEAFELDTTNLPPNTFAVAKGLKVSGKLGYSAHPMIEHFRFLKDHARGTAKMTIPAPSALHFRGGRKVIDETIYPDIDEFYRDLGDAYNQAVRAFADAGCRYLQLDEVFLAYLCDNDHRKALLARGDDPDELTGAYAAMINRAVEGRPADMTVTMHLCRGNFRSTWAAQGGYERVADLLFNQIDVNGYFMEYDSERAGGFEPLRFVPKGKTVVLGLVTSKTPEMESKDTLKRRIDDAAKFVDIDQLCLSPQCGFASTEEGNAVTEEIQWAKLALVVETAREVWG